MLGRFWNWILRKLGLINDDITIHCESNGATDREIAESLLTVIDKILGR